MPREPRQQERLVERHVGGAVERLGDEQAERESSPPGSFGGVHRSRGWRAASVWSSRRTGVVTGASWTSCGFDSASRAIWIMASQNSSSVSFDSVSVGSIISASSTMSGK